MKIVFFLLYSSCESIDLEYQLPETQSEENDILELIHSDENKS